MNEKIIGGIGMKSRFKIGILFTIGFTLLLTLFWTSPVSADHVTTVPDTSQSSKNVSAVDNSSTSSNQDNNTNKNASADTDTKASKAKTNKTSQSSSSRATDSSNTASASDKKAASSSSSATTNNAASDDQATATVTVPVVSSNQPVTNQSSTDQTSAADTKKVTLTTPSGSQVTHHQDLDQLALLPQSSKETLLLTGGVVALAWVPAVVVIFNAII